MNSQEFTGEIQAGRGGGAWVAVPPEVIEALGGGSRCRVVGSLNGVSFESSTMPGGEGRVCLGLHKATRQAARVSIGDRVSVSVERDDRQRTVAVPDDLVAALDVDPAVRAAFDTMAFTHRREYAEWVEGAKKAETRARRVAQTVERVRASSRASGGMIP